MPRPIVATIDSAALRHNLSRAKAMAPNARIWAVVKANAYGHGLAVAVQAFDAADGLALIEFDGAAKLRTLGWHKPILMLEGMFDPTDLIPVCELGLDIVVHNEAQIGWLEQAQQSGQLVLATGRKLSIHLKMNSGMNRLGLMPDAYQAAHARLAALPGVGQIVLMTHFANADQAAPPVMPVAQQMQRFAAGCAGLTGLTSLANSGATQLHAECHADWLRPGIMLYGGVSGHGPASELGLLPAMHLSSELISVQQIAAGESVGYASRFVASAPMRIGIVACGYADGYPRHAPTGTPVLVDGVRTRLVGQVSMDMIAVDLEPIPEAQIGSRVTLWGAGLPIDEVAQHANTIGYELMCALAPRVRQVLL